MRYHRRSASLARVSSEPSAPACSGLSAMLALAGVQSTALACLDSTVILADVSGSMHDRVRDGQRRYEVLCDALSSLRGGTVIPFDDRVYPATTAAEIRANFGTKYGGMTDYSPALKSAGTHRPSAVLLISDGAAHDPHEAVEEAVRLGVPVHTMFIGTRGELAAIGLLRRIAEATGGNFTDQDLGTGVLALTAAIQSTLALPQQGCIAL
jgi:hypothetical protein